MVNDGKPKVSLLARGAIALVKLYQQGISPWLPATCRFRPTCSQYCIEAIRYYGFFRGTVKTIWRLLRCNPWSKGGYDPPVK